MELDPGQVDWVRVAARAASVLVCSLVLAWLFRRALRGEASRPDASDRQVLRYGPALRWLFPGVGLGFAALYAVTVLFDPAGIGDPEAKLFWPMVLLEGLCLVGGLETWLVQIEIDGHGLASRSPWTGRRHVPWGQVSRVAFSQTWVWFVVEGAPEGPIRLHVFLGGLREFRAALQARVPLEVYAEAAPYLRRLEALALP